uniref:Chromosome 1 open reading frame 87 n=1 Tax=Salvator merianae TaxID=96440 RepID=A0A8D0DXU6_SALMN
MASVRNIPYGFNANYETVIKIVGSKYVRSLVEKTDGKVKDSVKAETKSMLSTLPPCNTRQIHGNPPGLSKLPCQQINYGVSDEQQNKGENEEKKSKQGETSDSRPTDSKNIDSIKSYCVTAPSGDKSLSYIHTLQKQTIGPQNIRQLERQKHLMNKPMETYKENDYLLAILQKEFELHPFNVTTLEKLQEEFKVLDPRFSGSLSQAHMSHLFLKHEVPLQLPTVKFLFKRFSEADDQVNYEKLLKFLTLVMESKTQQARDFPEQSKHAGNHCESFCTSEDALQTLKQILKKHKGQLSLKFLQEKSCSEFLSPSEVQMICRKHGLCLPPGLMETLVHTYEFGERDKIRWKTFVEFLKKVQSGIEPTLLVCRRSIREKSEDDAKGKNLPKCFPAKTCEQMKDDASDTSDHEEQDAWIDRFSKMEKALYLSDVKNTGKLEKEKAKRLVHNYNQIYNLCLRPLKIDKAFQSYRPGQDMLLEPLLHYLKEL